MEERSPCHVAVIPDGNRRWAKKRGLLSFQGHEQGAKALENLLDTVFELGIKYFSFWAASVNNLTQRTKEEVEFLEHLFEIKFTQLTREEKIHRLKVRINVSGRWRTILGKKAIEAIEKAMETTADYKDLVLNFLVAYNGTDEMVEAVKKIVVQGQENLDLQVTPELIKSNLWTKDLPPVDFLIRTGGEPHLSVGFMMWLIADAQLYFTEVLWPDFTPVEFKKAIKDYQKRERRFGR